MLSETRTYNTIIVDDVKVDRLTTQAFAKQFPFLHITGCCSSASEALDIIKNNKIDVLLLDIDMDDISGLELRRQLGNEQTCIFITSYPDYAVESFELAAFDFIVKPVSKERFAASMERLQEYLLLKEKASLLDHTLGGDSFFIKSGNEQVKIRLQDILYLEALKDYTRIVTASKKYCILSLLGSLLQEPAFNSFVRIHRSYAVQKNFIRSLSASQVQLYDNIALPVGRSYKESIEQLIHSKDQ